jgi:hypothetical protein
MCIVASPMLAVNVTIVDGGGQRNSCCILRDAPTCLRPGVTAPGARRSRGGSTCSTRGRNRLRGTAWCRRAINARTPLRHIGTRGPDPLSTGSNVNISVIIKAKSMGITDNTNNINSGLASISAA